MMLNLQGYLHSFGISHAKINWKCLYRYLQQLRLSWIKTKKNQQHFITFFQGLITVNYFPGLILHISNDPNFAVSSELLDMGLEPSKCEQIKCLLLQGLQIFFFFC